MWLLWCNPSLYNVYIFSNLTLFSQLSISSLNDVPKLPEHGPGPPDLEFNDIIITEQDVIDQLKILNVTKPPGPDGISSRILKATSSIYKPLTKLFNLFLSKKCLPYIWKQANVTPVFKNKGSADNLNNFRPISLTSSLCKIMEKVFFKYMFNYIKDNELLSKFQSGFQPGDSTVNQLVEIYDKIISSLDRGKDIRFIFCDISKAFDRVWHLGLIHKLEGLGFGGNILGWIEDYLTHRQQRVTLEGFSSTFQMLDAGVLQGSVLGPFLFLLYINDITNGITNNIRLFADDTSLFAIIDDDVIQQTLSITNDLNIIKNWVQSY